jgi:hypothetical protein
MMINKEVHDINAKLDIITNIWGYLDEKNKEVAERFEKVFVSLKDDQIHNEKENKEKLELDEKLSYDLLDKLNQVEKEMNNGVIMERLEVIKGNNEITNDNVMDVRVEIDRLKIILNGMIQDISGSF